MKRKQAVAGTLFVAMLMLQGCRGPYDPIVPGNAALPLHPKQQKEGVTMLTKSVRDALLLVNQTAARAPDGQVQIKTTLQNRYAHDDLWADVQHVFFDVDGNPVEKSEWRPVLFPAHELVLVEGSSLRTDTRSFNLQFKNLRSKTGRVPEASGFVFERGVHFESILPN